MPSSHKNSGPYGPGSLDYISLPNPVEPHAVPHKHPLNAHHRLDRSSNQDLRRLLNSPETPHKRRKCADGEVHEIGGETGHAPARSLPKPKLPINSSRRMRIPPTLSGLHQPPPEARVLPSINVEQPNTTNSTSILNEVTPRDPTVDDSQTAQPAKARSETQTKSKPARNRWTTEETKFLLDGVSRFGIGKWTQILKCSDYNFERRTAIDLKDRFRVCRPDDYEQGRSRRKDSSKPDDAAHPTIQKPSSKPCKTGGRSHQMDDSELGLLGFNAAFAKSERRRRRAYTSEEDAAILKGFLKHSKKWLDIQQDADLGLGDRTSTDIRDRMRTKYPEHYAQVCASRPQTFPKRIERVPEATDEPDEAEADAEATPESPKVAQKPLLQSHPKFLLPTAVPKQPALFRLDDDNDVFFGAPFEDESDNEPLILDRGILDWAISDARKVSSADAGKHGIDPAVILKRPAYPSVQNHQQMLPPFDGGMAPLPSLADITSGNGHTDEGQLELPSLMQYFGSIDTDARSGQIPTIEELLS